MTKVQPDDGVQIQMVRRFVKCEQRQFEKKGPGEGHAHSPTSGRTFVARFCIELVVDFLEFVLQGKIASLDGIFQLFTFLQQFGPFNVRLRHRPRGFPGIQNGSESPRCEIILSSSLHPVPQSPSSNRRDRFVPVFGHRRLVLLEGPALWFVSKLLETFMT